MKYRQLAKEQFESLHEEFAIFLASQQVDVKEWKTLKEEKPEIAEEELNVFSDVVWDDVLTRMDYIEHYSPKMINLFKCLDDQIERIVITVDKDLDLTTQEGYEWVLKNPTDTSVEILTGTKKYLEERNLELFDLIEKGGSMANGELFNYFSRLIEGEVES